MDEQLQRFNQWFMNNDIATEHMEACWEAFIAGERLAPQINVSWGFDDDPLPGAEGGSEDDNPDPFREH